MNEVRRLRASISLPLVEFVGDDEPASPVKRFLKQRRGRDRLGTRIDWRQRGVHRAETPLHWSESFLVPVPNDGVDWLARRDVVPRRQVDVDERRDASPRDAREGKLGFARSALTVDDLVDMGALCHR
jgi:hypothetical protein